MSGTEEQCNILDDVKDLGVLFCAIYSTGNLSVGERVSGKEKMSLLQTHFWLAHGFLSTIHAADGTEVVIPLENPWSGAKIPVSMIRKNKTILYFCLQESVDIPISI
jgi:hypothetical protein